MHCEDCGGALKTKEHRIAQACEPCLRKRVARTHEINRAQARCHVARAHAKPRDPAHPNWGTEPDLALCCYFLDKADLCPACAELKQRMETGDLKP